MYDMHRALLAVPFGRLIEYSVSSVLLSCIPEPKSDDALRTHVIFANRSITTALFMSLAMSMTHITVVDALIALIFGHLDVFFLFQEEYDEMSLVGKRIRRMTLTVCALIIPVTLGIAQLHHTPGIRLADPDAVLLVAVTVGGFFAGLAVTVVMAAWD